MSLDGTTTDVEMAEVDKCDNESRKAGPWMFGLRGLLLLVLLVAVCAIALGIITRAYSTAQEAAVKTICVPSLPAGAVWDRERAVEAMKKRVLTECLVVCCVSGGVGMFVAAVAAVAVAARTTVPHAL